MDNEPDIQNHTLALLRKMDAKIETIRSGMDTMRTDMTDQFERVDARFEEISKSLGKLNVEILSLKGRMRKVEEGIETIAGAMVADHGI